VLGAECQIDGDDKLGVKSAAEPSAREMNWTNSPVVWRARPSAMLDKMETAARRICEVSPNLSSAGNSLVDFGDRNPFLPNQQLFVALGFVHHNVVATFRQTGH
jgi:hypothetical protein